MVISMQQVLVLNKQVGETPLECMDRFRDANPEYVNVKMTYAGRLDPMADGVLIVLVGDAVHRKDEFSALDKEYVCTAILGVGTDSYDILGLPVRLPGGHVGDCDNQVRDPVSINSESHNQNIFYSELGDPGSRVKPGMTEHL